MTRIVFVLGALALVLAGCSMSADTAAAEDSIPKFHQLLDAGQFDAIYQQSSDDLKKAATQRDFVALLEAVHRKLGNTKSSGRIGWNVNYQTSGTFVTLDYKTAYDSGDANERFVFRMQEKNAQLAGYHINSTALILR